MSASERGNALMLLLRKTYTEPSLCTIKNINKTLVYNLVYSVVVLLCTSILQ